MPVGGFGANGRIYSFAIFRIFLNASMAPSGIYWELGAEPRPCSSRKLARNIWNIHGDTLAVVIETLFVAGTWTWSRFRPRSRPGALSLCASLTSCGFSCNNLLIATPNVIDDGLGLGAGAIYGARGQIKCVLGAYIVCVKLKFKSIYQNKIILKCRVIFETN